MDKLSHLLLPRSPRKRKLAHWLWCSQKGIRKVISGRRLAFGLADCAVEWRLIVGNDGGGTVSKNWECLQDGCREQKTNAAWASHPGRIVIADILTAAFRRGERSSRSCTPKSALHQMPLSSRSG